MKVIINGKIIEVTPNEAHALIEQGKAKIFVGENKQMLPRRGKGYKTK